MAQAEEQKVEKATNIDKQTFAQITTTYGLQTNISQMAQVGLGVEYLQLHNHRYYHR